LISQESLLFKYRFDQEVSSSIETFLRENDLAYTPLGRQELETVMNPEDDHLVTPRVLLCDLLKQVPYADVHQQTSEMIYFKVPFEDAIDLLRQRSCYLRRGYAYVSRANLSAIITTKFRARLSQHLGMTLRATAQTKQDVRIVPLVNMLAKQYITAQYKSAKIEGAVTKEQLPALSERSMPLCMSTLMNALKSENHLKHGGRMQLGLFLKGIGLALPDALAFWKQSFARRTPPEKFDKVSAHATPECACSRVRMRMPMCAMQMRDAHMMSLHMCACVPRSVGVRV
jgi:DNA primase large subunit